MKLPLALAVIAALVVASIALGLVLRARSGRVRLAGAHAPRVTRDEVGAVTEFGSRATLLQFSTEFCAPCHSAARVLGEAARREAGVVHIDVDLTERPDLASRFNILSTPTTLILDGSGATLARIAGAPRPAELDRQLADVLGGTHVV